MKKFRRIGVLLLAGLLCLTGCVSGEKETETESEESRMSITRESLRVTRVREALTFFASINISKLREIQVFSPNVYKDILEEEPREKTAALLRTMGREFRMEEEMKKAGYVGKAEQTWPVELKVLWSSEKGFRTYYMGYDEVYGYVILRIPTENQESIAYFENAELCEWLQVLCAPEN